MVMEKNVDRLQNINDKKEIILTQADFESMDKISNNIDDILDVLLKGNSKLNLNSFCQVTPTKIILDVFGELDTNADIDIFKILDFYNIDHQEVSFIENGYNGCVTFSDKKILIEYKKQMCTKATNRIIAHEFAHVFCHFIHGYKFCYRDNLPINGEVNRDMILQAAFNQSNDRFEKEADNFAADLLYPEYKDSHISNKINPRKNSTINSIGRIQRGLSIAN